MGGGIYVYGGENRGVRVRQCNILWARQWIHHTIPRAACSQEQAWHHHSSNLARSTFSTAAHFHCPGWCQAVLAKIGMLSVYVSKIATTH
jgi:hypothetical protein